MEACFNGNFVGGVKAPLISCNKNLCPWDMHEEDRCFSCFFLQGSSIFVSSDAQCCGHICIWKR